MCLCYLGGLLVKMCSLYFCVLVVEIPGTSECFCVCVMCLGVCVSYGISECLCDVRVCVCYSMSECVCVLRHF